MSFVLILTLLAAQSAPALVEDWEWDTTTPICTLRQTTPSTEIIEVSRTPGNEETEVKITVGMRRGFPVGRLKQGTLTLYPAGKASADGFFRSHNKKLVSYAVTSDPTFIGRFSDASAIGLSSDEVEQLRVTVRSAAAATEALRACEDRKMRAGGIDPIAWRSLKSRPMPLEPVRDRFSDVDYPADALRAGVEMDAIIRLDVGSGGSVQQCRALNGGAYRGFEVASCAVLKGARFQPAQDGGGTTVSAPYLFDVRFRIAK